MPAGGPLNQDRQLRAIALALLLAGTAIPAGAEAASTASSADIEATGQAGPNEPQGQDIVVTGQSLFRDVQPEHQLDQQAIESYGVSTVSDLLDEVANELADDQDPLVLVNGERVGDVNEIGGFPVEALRQVQILPRGSAVRVGGTSGQRVVNLTLTRKLRSATVTVAPKVATEGDWHSVRGETLLTYIQGQTRANLSFRARDESNLLESERNVVQPDLFTPFALGGNAVGFPDTTGEIDPLLSALAGEIVTVAPIPQGSSPTLANFAAGANDPAFTDLGPFRTLRPNLENYELNGSFYTRLAPWLSSNFNFKLNRSVSHSLRGLPSSVFVLSATNPASPFSRDVGLAFYGADPLRSRSVSEGGDARVTFNGRFGRWTSNLTATHTESTNSFDSDRQTGFGTIIIDDTTNPFSTDLTSLIGITSDRSKSKTNTNIGLLSFTGPIFDLPAGPVQTTVEGRLSWYDLESRSTFSPLSKRHFQRNEQSVRGAIDVPLTSRSANVLPQLGDIDFTAEYAHIHYSDAGSLHRSSVGLTWAPIDPLRLRGSIEETENAPSIQTLGNPIVQTPEVRVFDPLTGETVDVTQISGGNPGLRPEKVRVNRLGALLRLVPRINLQLDAEYTDTNARNFISGLPPASLPVMQAFPERYIRNADGTLTIVDLRPVNFDSHKEKRFKWGLSMRAKIASGNILGGSSRGDGPPPDAETGEEGQPLPPRVSAGRTPSTYFQLTANHTIVFSDKLFIRPGLDTVNLLEGGALGIGGGRVRHQVDSTAALTSGGLGARVGVTWRGASKLDTSIGGVSDTLRFSPLFLVNLRLFADARRFLPNSSWARGLRLSVDVTNLTNDRQKVRDSLGNTPLQYQPAYRDALGRTIEFEIRKVF
jgi:hypothetical protein